MLDEASTDDVLSCLVCLKDISRAQPIWSCLKCYTVFHLQCIQNWASQCIRCEDKMSSKWTCPKCQCNYSQQEVPKKYKCFCGKLVDPPLDPWLKPHSCGEVCGRSLSCSHFCTLLCHPGPCPPCPKMLSTHCHCGEGGTKAQRCGKSAWSCGQKCGHPLQCGIHFCSNSCHKGTCPPCPRFRPYGCVCGRSQKELECGESSWKCDQVCNAILSCRNHRCEEQCHPPNQCPPCIRSLPRLCPCGKKSSLISCLEDTAVCGDTCGRALLCGEHCCVELCHVGDCPPCRQVVETNCRCGRITKTISCSSNKLVCDYKCQRMRNCTRHQCKRKCCDGECIICIEKCNSLLTCGNHRCQAPCHPPPCYPCMEETVLECACGITKKSVPCGRDKTADPLLCTMNCKRKSSCHHSMIQPHSCHYGECPPCELICYKSLKECTHSCAFQCHSDLVVVQKEISYKDGPWIRKKYKEVREIKPCPPCTHKIEVRCDGDHEVREQFCSKKVSFKCELQCGRDLECGRHTCQLPCHVVTRAKDSQRAGRECKRCESICERERPEGCTHDCSLACHSGNCPPCKAAVKRPCYCGALQLVFPCFEWTSYSEEEKGEKMKCRGRCSRKLSCGHRCSKICHPSDCTTSENCTAKVTRYCPCKKNRQVILCNESANLQPLGCSEVCACKVEVRTELEPVRHKNVRSKDASVRKRNNNQKERAEVECHSTKTTLNSLKSLVRKIPISRRTKSILGILVISVSIVAILLFISRFAV